MYNWRSMSPEQREYVLARRKLAEHPWHSPPHRMSDDAVYHLTAANYEHRPILGLTPERMSSFESELLSAATSNGETIIAWCLLPNHYHLLLDSPNVLATLASLGRLHGSSSFRWNNEDAARGRKCWHRAADRSMRNERH